MKNILITILSLTLSYPSFASLGPDTDVPSLELGAEIQLDDKLSEELKAIQDPVFLYSEPTDELFKFDKNTGTAFKSSEAEYQTAAIPSAVITGAVYGAIFIVTILFGAGTAEEDIHSQECHIIDNKCYIELKKTPAPSATSEDVID